MKYGVLQGSVLGPALFSLFCNDFPDIAECEGILQMYVDNTATYTTAPLLDKVTEKLNAILEKLYEWCCRNQLSTYILQSCHEFKNSFLTMQYTGAPNESI